VAERGGAAEELSPLHAFVAAVAAPLDYLLHAPPHTLERTQVPAHALAARGRALAAELADAAQRASLETLVAELERYDPNDAAERRIWAQRCRSLVANLQGAPANTIDAGGRSSATPFRNPSAGVRHGLAEIDPPRLPSRYAATHTDPRTAHEQLQRTVQFVRGVGPRRAELFRRFGIQTIEDLLYHLPFRYDDRRSVRRIGEVGPGDEVTIIGELAALDERRVGRARRRILEGVLRDETGLLSLTWYHHMTYFQHRYRVGQRLRVHGKVERPAGTAPRIVHPEVELATEETGQGILPVYNKPTTMTVAAMRKLVQQVATEFAALVPSAIPEAVATRAGIVDLPTALRDVHLPAPAANVAALNRFATTAHRSLVFDELFFLQLGMLLRRRAIGQEAGTAQTARGDLLERLRASLPFTLTRAQRRVIDEILADMQQPFAMHRLVQGDVGSGKTVVALFAALVAIENGHQAAFMAPTELLAEQHFQTLNAWCDAVGVRAVLLTGECRRSERAEILRQLAGGEINLLVGTHALIQEGVRFHGLGLGVIDEQHRFGVLQRAALRQLGESGVRRVVPDMLLMTATPIPRTLALTLYGDLNISAIDELPPGRQPCRTLILNESERSRAYQLVKRELDAGRQAYIVYPLVEESEKEALRDATTMTKELRTAVFPGYRVGLVHGRMKAEEKESVMRSFRAGEIQLLVSTTVIEVGVDVPNATVMVVEHAERFGLSQLHQLRGRVGRGAAQATCILVAPYRRGEDVHKRLQTMAATVDGFRIAEVDLEIRGPGEFLGTRQSGLPDFRVANLLRDTRLLALARETAEEWLAHDPTLARPESTTLRAVLQQRWAGRLGLAGIG
jgi:ATP-dependent DNA helicase RecG